MDAAASIGRWAIASRLVLPDNWARASLADSLISLGQELAREGHHVEAAKSYRRAIAADPERGRFGSALSYYKRALELQPGEPMTVFYLATTQLATGDTAGARQQLEVLQQSRHPMADDLRRMLEGR